MSSTESNKNTIEFTLPEGDEHELVVVSDKGITIDDRYISTQDMYVCYAVIQYMTKEGSTGEALESALKLFCSKVEERIEEER